MQASAASEQGCAAMDLGAVVACGSPLRLSRVARAGRSLASAGAAASSGSSAG